MGGVVDSVVDIVSDVADIVVENAVPIAIGVATGGAGAAFGAEFLAADFFAGEALFEAVAGDFLGDVLVDTALDTGFSVFTDLSGDFLADFAYEQVGSFAGNASWFDSVFPGDIIDSVTSGVSNVWGTVSDFASDSFVGLSDFVTSPESLQFDIGDFVGFDSPSGFFDGIVNQGANLVNSLVDSTGGLADKAAEAVLGAGKQVAVTGAKQVGGQAISTLFGNSQLGQLAGQVGGSLIGSTTGSIVGYGGTATPGFGTPSSFNISPGLVNAALSSLVGAPAVSTSRLPYTLPAGNNAGYGVVSSAIPGSAFLNTNSTNNTFDPSGIGGGNFAEIYNPETELYDVYNLNTGTVVRSGLTQQAAILAAQDFAINDTITLDTGPRNVDPNNLPAYDDEGNLLPGYELDGDDNPYFAGFGPPTTNAADVNLDNFPGYDDDGNLLPGYELDEDNNPVFVGSGNNTGGFTNPAAGELSGLTDLARQQAVLRAQRQNQSATGDWRVKLRLAPSATYLYNSPDCGPVLYPLRVTDGVIFPYTPVIDMAYKANYDAYDLTHSNYRGYFYKNSAIDAINVRATFTAQDTNEANYVLAVIHFFRSVTKMFYGQDAERGAPPPLVYLSGFGQYQFNEHPCLVAQFNYSLPSDVDYIRAQSTLVDGTNLLQRRDRQASALNPIFNAVSAIRRVTSGLTTGALDVRASAPTLGTNNPTYVPTKMEVSLTLLPVQSRQQVSKQFSLKNFANGNLLKGGFW
jgi:hypothetical protein